MKKSTVIEQAHHLAESHSMDRKIINLKYDKVDKVYLALISIEGYISSEAEEQNELNLRCDQQYFEVSDNNLSEAKASRILLANATYAFVGANTEANIEKIKESVKKSELQESQVTESDVEPETKKADTAAKKPAKEKAKKAAKAKPEPKTVDYDRGIDAHKKQFSQLLAAVCPTWSKSDDTKTIAKGLSSDLDGKPFLDAKGSVLKEVRDMITEAFADGADDL